MNSASFQLNQDTLSEVKHRYDWNFKIFASFFSFSVNSLGYENELTKIQIIHVPCLIP